MLTRSFGATLATVVLPGVAMLVEPQLPEMQVRRDMPVSTLHDCATPTGSVSALMRAASSIRVHVNRACVVVFSRRV